MFGIGSTELLVILLVALVVLGPKSLPKMARTLGKAMGEFRRVSTDFQRTLNTEVALDEHNERKKSAEKEFFSDDAKTTASNTESSADKANAAKPQADTASAENKTTASA
ncbi:MAG: Sec-independent protein translocase protein TatB [Pseudomonadota bacterium]